MSGTRSSIQNVIIGLLLVALGVSGCTTETRSAEEIEKSREESYERDLTVTLPVGATNINAYGTRWATFELNGGCFLYSTNLEIVTYADKSVCQN